MGGGVLNYLCFLVTIFCAKPNYQTKPKLTQNYCLMQSTPGSVVPLAMFAYSSPLQYIRVSFPAKFLFFPIFLLLKIFGWSYDSLICRQDLNQLFLLRILGTRLAYIVNQHSWKSIKYNEIFWEPFLILFEDTIFH